MQYTCSADFNPHVWRLSETNSEFGNFNNSYYGYAYSSDRIIRGRTISNYPFTTQIVVIYSTRLSITEVRCRSLDSVYVKALIYHRIFGKTQCN